MKRAACLFIVLFFLCLLPAAANAQCQGGRVRAVAGKARLVVRNTVCRAKRLAGFSVARGVCAGGAVAGRSVVVVKSTAATATKPLKSVLNCVNGQCFK